MAWFTSRISARTPPRRSRRSSASIPTRAGRWSPRTRCRGRRLRRLRRLARRLAPEPALAAVELERAVGEEVREAVGIGLEVRLRAQHEAEPARDHRDRP